jgi:hypothetical protein
MPWIKVANTRPQEGEKILIYDNQQQRMEFGQYINGRWYVENLQNGKLREIAGVTHWAPILDSEDYENSDND